MPCERQLAPGREDPQAVVGGIRRGWQDERGLGEVRPAGEGRHVAVGDAVGVEDDGDRVAVERMVEKTSTWAKARARREDTVQGWHRREAGLPWGHRGGRRETRHLVRGRSDKR